MCIHVCVCVYICLYQISPQEELQSVWGIGPATAQKLISMGILSVAQLRVAEERRQCTLTRNQSIGKYYSALSLLLV
jgi:Holliday junction resolvasome RuvABC DNA-binding subunit